MDKPPESEKVACAVCRAEIPKAAALHAEGKDYVYHFCDTACFEHWDEGVKPEPKKP
jgi:YHS domain-containing protein